MDTLAHYAPTGAMLTMAAVAAYTDLKTGLIPNRVVLAGALFGGLSHAALLLASGQSAVLLAYSVFGGLLLCALVPGVFYALGALGGGDLKLFAAIGLCVGPLAGMDIQLWSCLLVMLFLPLYLMRRGRLRASLQHSWTLFLNAFRAPEKRAQISPQELTSVRFAPAIFAAALLVTWMREAAGRGAP